MEDKFIKNIGDTQYIEGLKDRFLFPFSTMNYLLSGGVYGRLAILYSKTDEGKSTLVSQILCECVKQKIKCFVDFGEDSVEEATERIYKQYTPYSEDSYDALNYYVNGNKTNIWEYHLTKKKWEEARTVFNEYLYLFDIKQNANLQNIIKSLDEARAKGCKVGVVDNLENIEEMESQTENKFMKDVAITLRNYAVKYNMYIILVCHVRKMEKELLIPEIEDIKGSSAVSNTAKDIVLILRTDKMNQSSKQYKYLKELVSLNNYDLDKADALIWVKKTKGNKLGIFTAGYNRYTHSYYELDPIVPFNKSTKDNTKPVLFNSTEKDDLIPIEDSSIDDIF